MTKQCVGIDVSKASLTVCVASTDQLQDVRWSKVEGFENNKKSFNQLLKWAKKQLNKDVLVAIERKLLGLISSRKLLPLEL